MKTMENIASRVIREQARLSILRFPKNNNIIMDVLNSTDNILPLSGLPTLTGQRNPDSVGRPVSGKYEKFIFNIFININLK